MDPNPYAPPRAPVEVSTAPFPEGDLLASRLRRFLTLLIDYFGMLALAVLIGVAVALAGTPLLTEVPELLFGVGALVLYYLPQETLFGRTLGKLLTGTRVVDDQGGEPSFKQILGRTFARLIPFEAFTFLRSDGVGLHDRLSDTRVVRVRI